MKRITSRVTAQRIGVVTSTLANWRCSDPPKGPQGWITLSPTVVVYDELVVDRWIAARAAAAQAPNPERREELRRRAEKGRAARQAKAGGRAA